MFDQNDIDLQILNDTVIDYRDEVQRLQYEIDATQAIKAERDAATSELAGLQSRCDHYINQWSEVCNDNQVLINERDAYAAAADSMAASHKVERDALKDAARMALDALLPFRGDGLISINQAIAALKTVLK